MKLIALSTVALALSLTTAKAETENHMSNLLELQGSWRGALTYLDYGNGQKRNIGMAAEISATPDDAFIVTRARYTDPGFDVFILNVTTLDKETGAMVESYHRDNDIEKLTYSLKSSSETKTGWVYIFEDKGADDRRDATIRHTLSLDGDVYSMRKDVDFLDDENVEFLFRNEVTLTRSDEPVSFDDFRKREATD